MRSLLFVPGDSPRKLEKGFAAGADAVIVDLEDSVAPAAKAEARRIAAAFLAEAGERPCIVYVRINDLSSDLADADLAALVPCRPDGIMLPKSAGGADVQQLALRLRVEEAVNGLPDGGIAILPIITETGGSLFGAGTYAGASPRLAGLTWGAEDLSAAVGATRTRDESGSYTALFRLARSLTLAAAASAEVAAIDTVFVDFHDMEGLAGECRAAALDGFTGKLAIHPAQVAVINAAFTPSPDAVAEARAVIEAFAAAGEPGVVAIGGRMFDRPHRRRAERLVARAASIPR